MSYFPSAAATLFLLTVAMGLSPAFAQESDPTSTLRINGFGTLGVTHADVSPPWGFRRDSSQPYNSGGTRFDTDSRLGVQADYALTPALEVVAQWQLRRRVASSTAEESLEWAFLAWRPTPDLTVRAGRTGPDIFLLSDYRSVGFAYPWVRPNVETYGLLPIFSVDGVDIAQLWKVGDANWRAKALAGVAHVRGPSGYGGDVKFTIDSLFGATLSREQGGLLLRATVVRGHGGLGKLAGITDLRSALAAAQSLPDPKIAAQAQQLADGLDAPAGAYTYLAVGASYERERWLLSAEMVRLSSSLSYAAADVGYVSIGRRFGALTAYGMVGAARPTRSAVTRPQWEAELTPLVGASAAAQFQAAGSAAADSVGFRVAQHSVSLGMRWDLHPQMALKVQWDRILVQAGGSGLWGNRGSGAATANIASAALDFVF